LPVIPAPGRLRQEDLKFEASLGCIARPVSKNPNQYKKTSQYEKRLFTVPSESSLKGKMGYN
jgi:hypothetical protein